MSLIIEGADNLGKSTAAKRLVSLAQSYDGCPPVFYKHMSRPPPRFDFLNDYDELHCPLAVQDRFHLGSLLWHKDVMTENRLRVIEGRLLAAGSLIVVFASSNVEWYEERVRESARDEMFDPSTIIAANRVVSDWAFASPQCRADGALIRPHIDIVHWVDSEDDFPNEATLAEWLNIWFERMEACRTPIRFEH